MQNKKIAKDHGFITTLKVSRNAGVFMKDIPEKLH